jgi:hypothetical protein
MAVSIVTTVGGASSNSYVTQAEATTYHEGRLNATAWSGATSDSMNRALVEAARELDVLSWVGTPADDTQVMRWPRQWAEDPDSPTLGLYYDSTEIPQRVKDAQCELALEFLKAGTTDVAALPANAELVSQSVDVLSKTFADPSKRRQGIVRFPRVYNLIRPLLVSQAGAFRVVRG